MGSGARVRRTANWLVVVMLGSVLALGATAGTAGPVAAAEPQFGIDVSNWQGDVDWAAVRASGHTFAFAKATEGVTFVDRWMTRNREGMASQGMTLRGLYHFAHPDRNTPAEEAEHFLSTVGPLAAGEVPVLDLEVEGGPGAGPWAAEWMGIVEQVTGRLPILYSYAPYLNDTPTQDLTRYPLWIAAWGRNDGTIPARQPNTDRWESWAFWQFTSKASVPGVNGFTDRSVFTGSATDLAGLAGVRGPVAPTGDPLGDVIRQALDNVRHALEGGLTEVADGSVRLTHP